MPPKKMGRPISDNPKDKTLRIRVDTTTLETLDECVEILNSTRSDVVRQGIKNISDNLK